MISGIFDQNGTGDLNEVWGDSNIDVNPQFVKVITTGDEDGDPIICQIGLQQLEQGQLLVLLQLTL